MQDNSRQSTGLPLLKLLVAAVALLFVVKVFLASVLDLYSDEVFYWQASANPALAYSDLPFMTALMIGLGSALDATNTLAARSLFILMGSTLPALVYWLARPITDSKQALEAAILSLCVPLGGFLGLLAVPDVPLIFFGLLSIGFFERALRTNQLYFWSLTGLAVALGLCTHYRFFLYPAAAIAFLILFKNEMHQWKNPRLWLCIAIASLGLIPILWFNLSNQLSSASFYIVDRHPWEFQSTGLLHLFKQAGLVTPPLYIVFAYTIYVMLGKAKAGDRNAALLLSFSLLNILVYLILAPWTDATSTSIHWPLSGYFPLLIFVPFALRSLSKIIGKYVSPRTAYRLVLLVPIVGFIGTLVAITGVGSQAFQNPLQKLIGSGVLSNKMAGWKPFVAHLNETLQIEFESEPLIITDNYYTLAQIEFSAAQQSGFTLDNKKAVRDGRITQYQLWNKDRVAFDRVSDETYLFVSEDSTLDNADKYDLLSYLCARTPQLKHLGELSLFNGDKQFSFYRGNTLLKAEGAIDSKNTSCPYPAFAWIDEPQRNAQLSNIIAVIGWAYNEDVGIQSINLIIDNEKIGEADYGGSRPDVVEVKSVKSEPNLPNFGYNYSFDSTQFENGEHSLEIEIINTLGIIQRYGLRTINIEN